MPSTNIMTSRSIFVYFVAFAVVGFVRGQITAEEEHDHDHDHDHHDHQDDAVVTDAATHDAHA